MSRLARAGLLGLSLTAALSCTPEPGAATIDGLDLPTGLAEDPEGRWLFVSNGNWDRAASSSALVVLDLEALAAGIAAPRSAGAGLDRDHPCREHDEDLRVECDDALLSVPDLGVRIPSGAGNIAIDRPEGPDGSLRLLIPTRHEPGITWVDAYGPGFGTDDPAEPLRLECGQNDRRVCDSKHFVGVGSDPSRLSVDTLGFRYAYLPHLLGRRLTLLDLDSELGPEVVDVFDDFFREDELFDTGLGGGFAVVQRACDVDGNAPISTIDCTRPFLFASQRFWEGMRVFRVASGLDVIVGGRDVAIEGPSLESAEPKPLMGGLVYEDPEQGDRLLLVHTTPPALSRIDTSVGSGDPRTRLLDTVSLCSNPNVVVVHRPELLGHPGPRLAAVSCYGSDEVAIVDLGVFVVVATVSVGNGPNELLIDAERQWLFVANTAESTLSLIDLDASSTGYLREVATVGLGSGTRED
ncbi:MAG: hypothetical protein KC457_19780 [Myxococcales bacterium]|nr:hypothetical protein [Myxococcales bacterium]